MTDQTYAVGDTFLLQFVWRLPNDDYMRALYKAEVLAIIDVAEKYMVRLLELVAGSQETAVGEGREKEEFAREYWALAVGFIGNRVTVAWETADGRPLHMRLATLTGEHDFFRRYNWQDDPAA